MPCAWAAASALSHLAADRERARHVAVELAVVLEVGAQVFAAQQLHHDERAPVGVNFAVQHLDDARVLDQGRRPRLVEEAPDDLLRAAQLRQQELYRGAPRDVLVLGQIHLSHPADAEPREELVAADCFADHDYKTGSSTAGPTVSRAPALERRLRG